MRGLWWFIMVVMTTSALGETAARQDWLGDVLPERSIQRLGTTRMTHSKGALSFCYLQNDRALVANGNKIEVLDLARGACLASHTVGTNELRSLATTHDGRQVVLVDAGGNIAVWDLADGRELRRWATGQKGLVHVCISPDGKRVLSTGRVPAILKEWDLSTGREMVVINGPAESFFINRYNSVWEGKELTQEDGTNIAAPVHFSMGIYGPGGDTALVGDNAQASLLHYNLSNGELIHQWYPDLYTTKLDLSADGRRLLVGSRHRATEWDLDNYRLLRAFSGHHGHQATAVAYCRQTNNILTGSRDGSIRRWDRTEGKVLLRWVAHQRHVSDLAVSPDGRHCLSFGAGSLVESDLQTGAPRLDWDRHRAPVLATAFVASGRQAVSSSADGTVRLWDAASGKTLRQFALPPKALAGYALAVSPDGTRLAVGGYLGIWEFDVSDGKQMRALTAHRGFVRALAYSPDGKSMASGADDGSIKLWTADACQPVTSLEGHRGGVLAVAISRDGKQAMSGGRDGTVRLWDIRTCRLLNICEGHRGWVEGVAFQRDRKHGISAGRDGRVLKWDLARATITTEMTHGDWLHALACSPDGREAYSAGNDGRIICWDLRTGRQNTILTGHERSILGLAISPDGNRLVSASQDNTLLVWDVKSR